MCRWFNSRQHHKTKTVSEIEAVFIVFMPKYNYFCIPVRSNRGFLCPYVCMTQAFVLSAWRKTQVCTNCSPVGFQTVFWAIFICSLTGIVIVLAGDYTNPNVYAANLCNSAFKTVPYIGTPILVFSLVIFSFTTIIGWGYYTEKALQFLCKGSNVLVKPSRVLFVILVFAGGVIGTSFSTDLFIGQSLLRTAEANMSTRFMWALVILTMTMMTVPNIWALWCFRKVIRKTTRKDLRALVGKQACLERAAKARADKAAKKAQHIAQKAAEEQKRAEAQAVERAELAAKRVHSKGKK